MADEPGKLSIKEWSHDDRPREKLSARGRSALTDTELLAILLGSGTRDKSAVELAREILLSVDNSLNKLGKLSIEELKKFNGVGDAKAIGLAAATELGRRRRAELPRTKPVINSGLKAYELLVPTLGDLEHEEFHVIYLTIRNELISLEQLSKGGITSTTVDLRLAFHHALRYKAVKIILSHNHPTGNLRASRDDKRLTDRMVSAGKILGIEVLDHVIVTANGYFSFADEGLI